MKFYLSILVLVFSCKGTSIPNSAKNQNNDNISIESRNLNPDEAIIEVYIENSIKDENRYISEARVLSIIRMGFSFKLNLNQGDLIEIESQNSLVKEESGTMVLEQQPSITSDKKKLLFKSYLK